MMKTSEERIARPSIPPIMLGILKGYVRHPRLTQMRILLKVPSFMKKIRGEYPRDLKKSCALMISMYSCFRKKLDRERALSLVKAVGIPIALSVQMANFRYVEAERNLGNLIRFQKRTNREGPTRMNRIEIRKETDRAYHFTVDGSCCFHRIFSEAGVPELTTVFCDVDNAVFNIYSPDRIVFHRTGGGNRIADGADRCLFCCDRAVSPVFDN